MAQQKCADCRAPSPATETQYTLIAKHRWRIVRVSRGGQTVIEWRCPECWSAHKARRSAEMPPPKALQPASGDASEAGRMFDRARQALTAKPPGKPR